MKYKELANEQSLQKTINTLKSKNYQIVVVENSKQALEEIKKTIPEGVSVMNGASVTLEQIGYLDYLKSGKHKWVDLHAKVNVEHDPAKRGEVRRQAALSDYYLGSVHALVENGDFIVASNTGSQLAHIVYTSTNLIFVISTKKIVSSLDEANKRLEEYIMPLENDHMQKLYGIGTQLNKIVIFKGESSYSSRKIKLILVKEDLGF